jgi:hypothetical protein
MFNCTPLLVQVSWRYFYFGEFHTFFFWSKLDNVNHYFYMGGSLGHNFIFTLLT